ncbi:MAG: RNA polymerase sigma factor [Actinomycetota bacterium]
MDGLTELLVAARDGDREAFAAFAHALEGDLWRYAAAMVGREEADDVVQDVLVRVWRAAPSYRGDAPARPWVLAITRRACADAVRDMERARRLRHRLCQALPPPVGVDVAEFQALLDAVHSLEPDQRAAFVLTQLVGCSYEETAHVCGVPLGTVRSRVARARVRLVELLALDVGGRDQGSRNSPAG